MKVFRVLTPVLFLVFCLAEGFSAKKSVPWIKARQAENQKSVLKKYKAHKKTQESVEMALKFLAKDQASNGSWSSENFRVGPTAMVLLAFLASGQTDQIGDYSKAFGKGLNFLLKQCNDRGDQQNFDLNYGTGVLLIFFNEYLLFHPENETVKSAVEKITKYLLKSFNGKGWRYSSRGESGDQDIPITCWIMVGLSLIQDKQIKSFGKKEKQKLFKQTYSYFKEMMDPASGRAAYESPRNKSSEICGWAVNFALKTMRVKGKSFSKGNAKLTYEVTKSSRYKKLIHDPYAVYWGTLSAFQHQGKVWSEWNKKVIKPLIESQETNPKRKERMGSWDPIDGGKIEGRALTTAMYTLALSSYYRYPVLK